MRLLKTAIKDPNPVIFFEHKKLLLGGIAGDVPEDDYTIPLGQALVRKPGADATVVAFGFMVHAALEAAKALSAEGIEVEVIDPRTIVPMDEETIFSSLEKTGRLITVEESRIRGGLGAEIAALACSDHFSLLKSPVARVAAPPIPIPGSMALENLYLPSKDSIISAVKKTVAG